MQTTYKLTERLRIASSYAKPSIVYMDIGAGHGYLSLDLESKGYKMYAVENKKGPYDILKDIIKSNYSNVECLFASGLDIMPSDVNGCFLLGMGANTMEEILFKDMDKFNHLESIIVEPQTDPYNLFKRLYENGFYDDIGCYVFEKHPYPLLRFTRCEENKKFDEFDYMFGSYPLHHKDIVLEEKLETNIKNFNKLIENGITEKEKDLIVYQKALEILKD